VGFLADKGRYAGSSPSPSLAARVESLRARIEEAESRAAEAQAEERRVRQELAEGQTTYDQARAAYEEASFRRFAAHNEFLFWHVVRGRRESELERLLITRGLTRKSSSSQPA